MKKRFGVFLGFIFSALLIVPAVLTGCYKFVKQTIEITLGENIKNVIVIIGDGMGYNHIDNSKTYFGIDKYDFENYYVCPVTTRSMNKKVTDSAAAASALATGTKVDNKNVSRYKDSDIQNIMEIASSVGMNTGVVTSDDLYGATPACYSSHANNRGDYNDIINGQVNSGVDVFVGKASSRYDAFDTKFSAAGYLVNKTAEEFFAMEKPNKSISQIASLRSLYNAKLSGQTDFTKVVSSVLENLDQEDGFCLMIENAYIDKCSHDNDIYGMVCEVRTLSDIFDTVISYLGGRDDTAIIVTADHETGKLAKASSKSDIKNSLYKSGGHTSRNVPLYLKGVEISGYQETIDNTNIFDIYNKIVQKKKAA